MDNQKANATLPAVVSLAEVGGTMPAIHLSVVKRLRISGQAVEWWDYVSVRLLELDVSLEPQFVQVAHALA